LAKGTLKHNDVHVSLCQFTKVVLDKGGRRIKNIHSSTIAKFIVPLVFKIAKKFKSMRQAYA